MRKNLRTPLTITAARTALAGGSIINWNELPCSSRGGAGGSGALLR